MCSVSFLFPITTALNYRAADASTAGTVLIIAKTCPFLLPSLSQSQMAQSWDECQDILKCVASFNTCGQQSLKLLQTIYTKVSAKPLRTFTMPHARFRANQVAGRQSDGSHAGSKCRIARRVWCCSLGEQRLRSQCRVLS